MAGEASVIAGFSGELISHSFIEQELIPSTVQSGALPSFARQIGRWQRQVERSLGPASSARTVHDVAVAPLLALFGYAQPSVSPHPLGLCGPVPNSHAISLTVPWAVPLHTCWRAGVIAGAAAGVDWTLICNGQSLLIVDCSRPWARRGVEFRMASMTESLRSVAALWILANARALSSANAGSLRSIVDQSDAHGHRVCAALGDGVLEALPRLASALSRKPSVQPKSTMDQALTVVYRILFLLFAEAHGMVPVWNELYREAYSIDALAQKALCGNARGMWAALRAISRLAHAGCRAGDLKVTAFNGRLFSPRHTPLVEDRTVSDAAASEVLKALATETTRGGRRRISYFDLGVEQLGSVYERVLDYEPIAAGRSIRLSKTGVERKATGSFYTPRSITEFLVRRTLAPLVDGRTSDQILQLRVVDPAMGSGAFLVAACRFLADRCEQANVLEGRWSAAEVCASDRAELRRQVAEKCLFGVDLNPVAVQLARLSLWLTTLAGQRPLTFLDHHLAAGNSLLGARLADLSQPPRRTRRRREHALPLLDDQLSDTVARHVLPARLQLAALPSNSLDEVKTKERLLADLTAPQGPIARWAAAADAWSAAALSTPAPASGLVAEWIAAAIGGQTTLPRSSLTTSLRDAQRLAAAHGAFHWELMFPEVFFAANGRLRPDAGFDAVIGNPPWDMLRADAGNADDRAAYRSHAAGTLRFFRDSGIYRLQGHGHANRYQLFVERALHLTRPGGRIGLILPSGLATDHGSAALRRHLFERTAIDTWLGFDNRRRIFPIHRSMRFILLATSTAGETETLRFRSGLTEPHQLEADDGAIPLTISRSRLSSWSDDLAVPEVPDQTALAILTSVCERIPRLSDQHGWQVRFGRELNATDDRPHFVPADTAHLDMLRVIEGKMLAPFQVDVDKASMAIPMSAAERLVDRASLCSTRIAYRDVASATNKLTLIAAILPPNFISTHTVFVSKAKLDEPSQWCLLALLNSWAANFLVRSQVMTHVTTALMARLRVPRPAANGPIFSELVRLSKSIAERGVDSSSPAYARLNALAATAYALSADQFAYVTETFPLVDSAVRERARQEFALLHGPVLPRLQ